MTNTTWRREHIILALILLLALALRLVFFTGIGMSDSLTYAEFSYWLSDNTAQEETNYSGLRLGLFYPVSVLYSLFGVSEITSTILVLLLSLAGIVLIFKFGELLFNREVGLMAAFLLSVYPLDIIYSTRLMTDLPAAFFTALGVYFFLRAEKKGAARCYLFSGLSLGMSYLIREMYLIIGLFFLCYVIYTRRIKAAYFLVPLGFVLVFSVEMLFLYSLTGNPFYRLIAVDADVSKAILLTNMYGRGDFPVGLLHFLWLIFTDDALRLYFTFAFIAMGYCVIFRKKETYPLLLWFVPVFLYINFGSTSLTQYLLIPVASRHFFIISMPLILLLAYFLMLKEEQMRKAVMPATLIIFLASSLIIVSFSSERFQADDERAAYDILSQLPKRPIYTDHRTFRAFEFFSGYRYNENLMRYNEYDYNRPDKTMALNLSEISDAYVVINQDMLHFLRSSKKGIVFPPEVAHIPPHWKLLHEYATALAKPVQAYYIPQEAQHTYEAVTVS